MKKHLSVIGYSLILGVAAFMMVGGCTFNLEQAKVITRQAGLYSAVTWIAVDNPTDVIKTQVVGVLTLVKDKASMVSTNQSYSDTLYPVIMQHLNDVKCPQQYKPLVMVGSATILGGIDMVFASYPEWKAKQDVAVELVGCFCDGAVNGLGLKSSDPLIKSAMRTSHSRMKAFQLGK